MSSTNVQQSQPDSINGYKSFILGGFSFRRDDYFVHIAWTSNNKKMSHIISADAFLRALMRDVAWGFFYGTVNFDNVFGTTNKYGSVEMFAGTYNKDLKSKNLDLLETFDTPIILATFKSILEDWTNEGFDPFAAPAETGQKWIGQKNGNNIDAISRQRQVSQRQPGVPGDIEVRSDENGYKQNRAFSDVSQSTPEIYAEPGFENEVNAFNLFAFLSRSDVTWNPSVTSVCKESLFCPTTEEYILPIAHGNDRAEWFFQMSDQIDWSIQNDETGQPRAKVIMKAGDIAAMPADCRHTGYSPKRSMLLVWENANPELPNMYAEGKLPMSPVQF